MEPVSEGDERRVRALERIAGILGWAAGVAAVALIVSLLGDILLLVFAASLFALGLRALMTLLGRKIGTGSGASLAIVVSALLALLGAGAWWAGPRLESEAGQLQDQLVEQWTVVRAWLRASSWGTHVIHQLPASVGGGSESSSFAPRVAGIIAGALWSGIGVLGTIVLVIATAIYFAAAPGLYINGPLRLVPKQHRGVTRHVLGVVGHSLQFWLAGQLLDMMVVGAVTGGGLASSASRSPLSLASSPACSTSCPTWAPSAAPCRRC